MHFPKRNISARRHWFLISVCILTVLTFPKTQINEVSADFIGEDTIDVEQFAANIYKIDFSTLPIEVKYGGVGSGAMSIGNRSSHNYLSTEPSLNCPAGFTPLDSTWTATVSGNDREDFGFTTPQDGRVLFTGYVMEGRPDLGCSLTGNSGSEPSSQCSQYENEESIEFILRKDGTRFAKLGSYFDQQNPQAQNAWFPIDDLAILVPADSYQLRLKHESGANEEVTGKVIACFQPATIPPPAPEPDVMCPAGYTQLGGIMQDSIQSTDVNSYAINIPDPGNLIITGYAKEGHPEDGCSPSGSNGNETLPFRCSQRQTEESFEVTLRSNGGSTVLGTYDDHLDPNRENYWFPIDDMSAAVSSGSHDVEIRHVYESNESVDHKLVACFRSQSAPPIPLTCSDGSAPILLDWADVSWNGGDRSNTYSNVNGSGHDITLNWSVSDANFRDGRPRIANDPQECPSITGDYCAASTANVSNINAEHAVEIVFDPPVEGVDITVGDLQNKVDGGASPNEIIEGISLTRGPSSGLFIYPGDNIAAGQNRTDYRPTTDDEGKDNEVRFIWNNSTVNEIEFTMLNDNTGPQIYGNALSYNLSGLAFCPAVTSSGTDYGDAPASYGSPQNEIVNGISIGSLVDGESTSLHSNDALGDDQDNLDDDDGISFVGGASGRPGETVTVNYTVYNTEHFDDFLKAWVDWDQSGSFQPNPESIHPGSYLAFFQSASAQTGSFDFTVPDDAACGTTYARFRLASDSGFNPVDSQSAGETEDYTFFVDCSSPPGISGTVFEDVNYGGGAGRSFGTAGTAAVPNATVELYDDDGNFVTTIDTLSDGTYSFTGMPDGDYYVRVVNETVSSTRAGSDGSELGIMTYRSDGVSAATNEIGGRHPAGEDAGSNDGSASLNTATFVFSGGNLNGQLVQSVTPVTLTGSGIAGVDFGFNFSTIVNTNGRGQGSLRQFMQNSSDLSSSSMVQAGSRLALGGGTESLPAGVDTTIFMIPASSLSSNGVAIIDQTPSNLILNGANADNTAVDGTTQTVNIGNTNSASLGTGGTVGVDNLPLSQVAGPEVQINGRNLWTDSDGFQFRGIAYKPSGTALNIEGNTRYIIEMNVFGADAHNFAPPAAYAGRDLVFAFEVSEAIFRNNLVGYSDSVGLYLDENASNWTIENNEFRDNRREHLDLETRVVGTVVRGNLMSEGGSYAAIQIDDSISGGTDLIENNTIENIGLAGIAYDDRSGANDIIRRNIIRNNGADGIWFANFSGSSSIVTISENHIYNNSELGIDLRTDNVTLNDANDADTGPNSQLNFPAIANMTISGSSLIIEGCAPAGATVELFEADVSIGGSAFKGDNQFGYSQDYGEGEIFLASFVEGSSADSQSGTCSLLVDVDGNDHTGMARFQVAIPLPADLDEDDSITATATVSGVGTSEFSPIFEYDEVPNCAIGRDTDNDTVDDGCDLDDDNDGVLDTVENGGAPWVLLRPSVIGIGGGQTNQNGSRDLSEDLGLSDGSVILNWVGANSHANGTIWQVGANNPTRFYLTGSIPAYIQINHGASLTGAGEADGMRSLDGIPYTFITSVESGYEVQDNGRTYQVVADGTEDSPNNRALAWRSTDFATDVEIFTTDTTNISAHYHIRIRPARDHDLDGIPNHLDLDSDNDGISDLVESGANPNTYDPDFDGEIDGAQFADEDNDGLADNIEAWRGDDRGTNPRNFDRDAVRDYHDLDSDNDGIPDSVEAQLTVGYNTDFGNDGDVSDNDSDGDGVIDVFDQAAGHGGSFNAPQNTDGSGRADYIDTDSDADTLSDTVESGLALSGNDANDDGIDDVLSASYADPDGIVNIPATQLQDLDNDVFLGGDVDYRDAELTISGLVWDDEDVDGIRQDSEALFPDVTVEIFDSGDNLIDTAATNSSGTYSLTVNVANLQTGYYIAFAAPADYLFTLQDVGGDDTVDSDPDPYTGQTDLLTYPANESVDAGIFSALFDHGDAPSSYGDSFATADLPYDSLWLGGVNDTPDTELTPLFSADADGDNNDGIDDEQAVRFVTSENGSGIIYYLDKDYVLDIEVYNPAFDTAYLEGWVDFDGNGQFDSYEVIISQQVARDNNPQLLTNLTFVNPINAGCGNTYARFRLATQQLVDSYGYAGFGETEDYKVRIDCRTDLEINAAIIPTPTIQLSEFANIDLIVTNNGPNPARQMTVTFDFPSELVNTVGIPENGWTCNFSGSSATCNKFGLDVNDSERVLSFTGRVPGTYPHDVVAGTAEVEHEEEDIFPANNIDTYSVDVDKVWVSNAEAQYIQNVFLYAKYDDALGVLISNDRDFAPDEIVINPLNVPINFAIGIESSSYPTLTTRFCDTGSEEVGCEEATDIITGTILVNSYTFITMTLDTVSSGTVVQTSGVNLITSTQTILIGTGVDGRFADSDVTNCSLWIDRLDGLCMAPKDIWSGSDDAGLYAWLNGELSEFVLTTAGGRQIDCADDNGDCKQFKATKPGIYRIQGEIDYEILFYDPVYLRLNDPVVRIPNTTPFTFFFQALAPFIEGE